jgi:hypothetical protein
MIFQRWGAVLVLILKAVMPNIDDIACEEADVTLPPDIRHQVSHSGKFE